MHNSSPYPFSIFSTSAIDVTHCSKTYFSAEAFKRCFQHFSTNCLMLKVLRVVLKQLKQKTYKHINYLSKMLKC